MRNIDEPVYDRGAADERTRQIPRVTTERDEDVTVNVDRTPHHTEVRHVTPSNVIMARKAQQVVWYFFGVLETLLALRFILLALGANPANPFFNFVLGLTNPLVYPFANLVETPRLGASILELGTVFAMIIYLLIAIAIAKLLELLLTRGDSY